MSREVLHEQEGAEKISSEYSLKSEVPGRLWFNQTLQTTCAEPHHTVKSNVQKKKSVYVKGCAENFSA